MWVKVIKSIYGKEGGLEDAGKWEGGSSTWSNIIKVGSDIEKLGIEWKESFGKKVGNGEDTSFWSERWLGKFTLAKKFPRLFKLEKNPFVTVRDRMPNGEDSSGKWRWDWFHSPRGRSITELDDLENLLESFSPIMQQKDRWRWMHAKKDEFEVKLIRNLVELYMKEREVVEVIPTVWSNLVPKKVSIFIWRTRNGSIPVRTQLVRRGIDIPSILCPMCNDCVENIDHVLVRCRVSRLIWEKVFAWWGIERKNIVDINQILTCGGNKKWKVESRKIWEGVIWSFLYMIWRQRNAMVFQKKKLNVEVMFIESQWRVFLWIKSRYKKVSWNWHIWCNDPVALFKSK